MTRSLSRRRPRGIQIMPLRHVIVTGLVIALAEIAAVLTLGAALAHASRFVDASTSTTVERDLSIAEAHWGPAVRCSPAHRITVAYDFGLARRYNALSRWSWDGRCRISISTTRHMTRAQLCTVLIHEYGHLAGRGHSASGIMRARTLDGGYVWPACR